MQMLQSYFVTGRYVILDSGFCVLMGLIALNKAGCVVIKKPWYWPYLVPGEAMDRMFDKQEVGASMAISGQLNGKEYFLWGLKEPSYVMKMMVTGGPLVVNDDCEPQKRYWTEGGVEKFKMT
jgi:hypothetical protein